MSNKRSNPRRRPKTSQTSQDSSAAQTSAGLQRLNKVLAAAGFGSRREVEELIVQGRVEVDREIVTDLSRKIDPRQSSLKVDGQQIKKLRPVYFMLNKPKGVLSTNKDPSGRMRVVDFVPDNQRVFSVGRLDKSSEGLMLLTNDGELAQRLAHPKYGVQKTYFVVVAGIMTREELAKLHKGVYLAEGFARIDGATIRKQRKASTELEIVLSEGKNREIRRILARAGHKVLLLRRIAIGPLRLGQLPVGASRLLTPNEIKALKAYSSQSRQPQKKTPQKRKSSAPASSSAPPAGPLVEDNAWPADDDFSDIFGGPDDNLEQDHELDLSASSQGSVLAYDSEPGTGTPRPKRQAGKARAHKGKRSSHQRSSKASQSQPRSTAKKGKPAGRKKLSASSTRPKTAATKTSSRKPNPSKRSGSPSGTKAKSGKSRKGRGR